MAEIISCPSCQRKLQVPETLEGQDVQCPTCSATFVARINQQQPPSRYGSDRPPENAGERWSERRPDYDRPPEPPRPWDDRPPSPYGGYSGGYGGYDDYGRRRGPRTAHRGPTILILGILGLVVLPILCPIAWIMGNADVNEIRAGRMDPEGESMTQAGRVCGIVGTVIYGILFCCCGFSILSSMPGMH
jgi:hypothetical protein